MFTDETTRGEPWAVLRSESDAATDDRRLFAELTRLEGKAGAKEVVMRHAQGAHFLSFRNGEVDVDTPDDF